MTYKKNEKNHYVVGIFHSHDALESAIDSLKSQNFNKADISILIESKAPEGATTGAATGAVAGGIFGWLLGAGTMTVPGLGPFIAAGPLMAAIAGAGVGGTIGGIAGGLIGLGITESEARHYSNLVRSGGLLISIRTENQKWEEKALDILKEKGASHITTTKDEPIDDSFFNSIKEVQEFDERRYDPHA